MPLKAALARLGLLVLCSLLLQSCTYLANSGPTAGSVRSDADNNSDSRYVVKQGKDGSYIVDVANSYFLVKLTPAVVQALLGVPPTSFTDTFGDEEPAPDLTIGSGDMISVSIWEAGQGSLFSGPDITPGGTAVIAGSHSITLPSQMVDREGAVNIPFVGNVKIGGLSTAAASQQIAASLKNKAIQPQALVVDTANASNFVTVTGDVVRPGEIPLSINGSRLLDVLALAGGTTAEAHDCLLQLTRAGKTKRIRLSSIFANPTQNIYLRAHDLLLVIHDPETVTVLGAALKNAQVPFDTEHLSLAEAIGKAGGLVNIQADATGVFVVRYEPTSKLNALGLGAGLSNVPEYAPVVFEADLQQPETLLLIQAFQMHDKDLVYVATSQAVQLEKLILMLRDTSLIFQNRWFDPNN